MKLYRAEWCPLSHGLRAKLTELGVDYELVNVSASAEKRTELEEVAGTRAIPVLVDGQPGRRRLRGLLANDGHRQAIG